MGKLYDIWITTQKKKKLKLDIGPGVYQVGFEPAM